MKLAPQAGLKVGLNSDVIQFIGKREKNDSGSNGHTKKKSLFHFLAMINPIYIYIYLLSRASRMEWSQWSSAKSKAMTKKGGGGGGRMELAGVTSNKVISQLVTHAFNPSFSFIICTSSAVMSNNSASQFLREIQLFVIIN